MLSASFRAAVRVQKRWSLHEVQLAAKGEFSAAAVGSYERGERLISVPRLNRLAHLYRVPLEITVTTRAGVERREAEIVLNRRGIARIVPRGEQQPVLPPLEAELPDLEDDNGVGDLVPQS